MDRDTLSKFIDDFGHVEYGKLIKRHHYLATKGHLYFTVESPILPKGFMLVEDCIEEDGSLKHYAAGGIPGIRTRWQQRG